MAVVGSRGGIACFALAFSHPIVSVRSIDRSIIAVFNPRDQKIGLARGEATISISGSYREKALVTRCAAIKSSTRHEHSKSKSIGKRTNEAKEHRSYCPRCHRPTPTCLCHALPPQRIPLSSLHLRLLILQHPREARKRKRTSTVPLIGLCLDGVEICVGTSFGCEGGGDDTAARPTGSSGGKSCCPEALRRVLEEPKEAILLYPGEGAVPLTERYPPSVENEATDRSSNADSNTHDGTEDGLSLLEPPPITTIVVLDGTWAQTQSMMQSSPALTSLPQCMFEDDTDSLFEPLRHEPAGHCTSTLEAISRSLRVIGSSAGLLSGQKNHHDTNEHNHLLYVGVAKALERSLEAMVQGQLRYAADETRARPRSKKNNYPLVGIVEEGASGDNATQRVGKSRKVKRRRKAQLQLARKLSEAELEDRRIRFIYVAHLG